MPPKKNLKSSFPLRVPAYRSGRQGEAGGRGVWGEFRHADLPAEVSTQAGPSQFRSDIFKQTPQKETSEFEKQTKNGELLRFFVGRLADRL